MDAERTTALIAELEELALQLASVPVGDDTAALERVRDEY